MSDGIVFSMRGAKGPQYHGSYVRTPMEIRGAVSMSGPQPVSNEGGVPELVHQLFQAYPGVKRIALGTDTGGVVYHRMDNQDQEPQAGQPATTPQG